MKTITISLLFFVSVASCKNSKQQNHLLTKNIPKKEIIENKDTIIVLNDSLSIYYATYNPSMKLWYNLYIIKNKSRKKLSSDNKYQGVGSELFSSLSPNAKYVVVDAINKDYVFESANDSVLHENYSCNIINLNTAKIIKTMQEDCSGEWNKKNEWISNDGKIIFK